MSETQLSRKEIKEVLDVLKHLPDFDRLPIPDSWGAEFNIPITPARELDLMQFFKENQKAQLLQGQVEIRGPAEGGVREVPSEPAMTLEVSSIPVSDGQPQR